MTFTTGTAIHAPQKSKANVAVTQRTAKVTPLPVRKAKKEHPYYDYGPMLSHNGTYNFVIGGRGLGKTYGAKRLALQNWFRRGEQFIYLRRYQEELHAKNTFFADIQSEYPEWDFDCVGTVFRVAHVSTRDAKKREWTIIGYAFALSKAQQQKSQAFPEVRLIIFDEFLIEKGMIRYLPNEAEVFNNFYSTVDRWQDKTRVVFLANSISIANPYFLRYRIQPSGEDELLKYNNGFIVVHLPNSVAFKSSVMHTKFGQFIEGTEYADYAVGNQFKDNKTELVAPKNPRARVICNLETRLGWVSIWQDALAGIFYVARRRVDGLASFTLIPSNVTKDCILVFPNDGIVERVLYAYRKGMVEFDEPATNNIIIDIFDRKQ